MSIFDCPGAQLKKIIYIFDVEVIVYQCKTSDENVAMIESRLDRDCPVCKEWNGVKKFVKKGTQFMEIAITFEPETPKCLKFAWYRCHDEGHFVGPMHVTNIKRADFTDAVAVL